MIALLTAYVPCKLMFVEYFDVYALFKKLNMFKKEHLMMAFDCLWKSTIFEFAKAPICTNKVFYTIRSRIKGAIALR